MLLGLIVFALFILIYLPRLWVAWVMKKNAFVLKSLPGTGGELAVHLLKRFGMDDYVVEEAAPNQDHFSPNEKAVRLSPANFHGRSVTAVAVAAHEVGHAIQHFRREEIFQLRSRYLPAANMMGKVGIGILWLLPVIGIVIKAPAAIALIVAISLLFQFVGALGYLIVLPEEWDASFNKALPILVDGEYLPEEYYENAKDVLKAAALTYFAGALANILNLGRLFLIFRR